MSPKFSKSKSQPTYGSPIRTTGQRAFTEEGNVGFLRDPKSELFLLAVSNMVGETTYYETAQQRDARFAGLVRQVSVEDPDWMQRFIPFLRKEMFMRSASVVAACEYAWNSTLPNRKHVIDSACFRADEPAEALGYWLQTHGRPIPIGIRRGIALAAQRLYTERNALKYDGVSRDVRMADVVELCKAKPKDAVQGELFKYLIDRRHGRGGASFTLPTIAAAEGWRVIPKEAFLRELLSDPAGTLAKSALTWETVSERVPGGMTAEVWEALIPTMGHMALIRNLRNFEEAGISQSAKAQVVERITNPIEIIRGMQFPIRYYTAYAYSGTLAYGPALARALEVSLENVPKFKGRTLVLIDQSGSMYGPISARSQVTRSGVAALFGLAVAKRSEEVKVVSYATTSTQFHRPGELIRQVEWLLADSRQLGGGTNTTQALTTHYNTGYDRVIIVTDEQAHPGQWPEIKCPLYTFNVAGYAVAHTENGKDGKYAFGGLSDACFRLIDLLERKQNAGWEVLF